MRTLFLRLLVSGSHLFDVVLEYKIRYFLGDPFRKRSRIQRLLVQHWIQVYVSLRRLLEYLTYRVRPRHGQWYVLAGCARHDTPHAVYPSIVGWSVLICPLLCWTVWSRQFRDQWRLHRSSSFMVVDIPFVPQKQISMVLTICSPWSFTSCSSFLGDRCPWYAGRAGSSESFARLCNDRCPAYVPQLPLIYKVVFTPVEVQSCSPWLADHRDSPVAVHMVVDAPVVQVERVPVPCVDRFMRHEARFQLLVGFCAQAQGHGFPSIRVEKGWRGRRELALRRSATRI